MKRISKNNSRKKSLAGLEGKMHKIIEREVHKLVAQKLKRRDFDINSSILNASTAGRRSAFDNTLKEMLRESPFNHTQNNLFGSSMSQAFTKLAKEFHNILLRNR